jgi:hypothetical protein
MPVVAIAHYDDGDQYHLFPDDLTAEQWAAELQPYTWPGGVTVHEIQPVGLQSPLPAEFTERDPSENEQAAWTLLQHKAVLPRLWFAECLLDDVILTEREDHDDKYGVGHHVHRITKYVHDLRNKIMSGEI